MNVSKIDVPKKVTDDVLRNALVIPLGYWCLLIIGYFLQTALNLSPTMSQMLIKGCFLFGAVLCCLLVLSLFRSFRTTAGLWQIKFSAAILTVLFGISLVIGYIVLSEWHIGSLLP